MSEVDRIEAAAETLSRARLSREALGDLPEALRPRDEAEAYRVQSAVHRRLAGTRYGVRVGRKIGCTTKVMQDYLAIPNPCAGGLFAGTVHASGASLPFDDYRRVGVECEIAVRLAHDLPRGAAPFTAEAAGRAVGAFMTAIEIVDDRYENWRTIGTPTLIADDFFAAGAVLGPAVELSPAAVMAAVGTTVINGAEVGRGRGADVMDSPLNALAWLANSLAARGEELRRDEIILLGSLVETRWLARGDRVAVAVSGLGEVTLNVV